MFHKVLVTIGVINEDPLLSRIVAGEGINF
jgi:hypothetical protein